ncbi:MAG: acylphosphatase [Candidatus Ozemobacteraceae bacterium]
MIKRAELVIHGTVQGVGFRGFTRRHAPSCLAFKVGCGTVPTDRSRP